MVAALVAGCSAVPPAQGVHDPNEPRNRAIHAFNKDLDRRVLRPVTGGAGGDSARARPVARGLANLGDTLDEPSNVVNGLLQGRLGTAGSAGLRFAVNVTLGLGGLFDPATALGIARQNTDFGETLHVWGLAEGPYQELPLLGPSTRRDTVGKLADLAANPLNFVLEPRGVLAAYVVMALASVADRGRFGDTVDEILYESADSYAQVRLMYLQNRRFELARNAGRDPGALAAAADDPYADPYDAAGDPYADDPYSDPYADPYSDPYFDPYEDPYDP